MSNPLDTMSAAQHELIMSIYAENEESNSHAENYLFLAETMRDDEAVAIAQFNLTFIEQFGYANIDLRRAAHDACNDYYYQIKALYA